jgi:hypothetical protein
MGSGVRVCEIEEHGLRLAHCCALPFPHQNEDEGLLLRAGLELFSIGKIADQLTQARTV